MNCASRVARSCLLICVAAVALRNASAQQSSGDAATSAPPTVSDGTPLATSAAVTPERQSLTDAWWTGPMLANSAATLPRGHFLAEPYVYDVIGAAGNTNGFGSRSYLEYGLVDRLTIGAIPVFGFNEVNGGLNSSHVDVGDITLMAQYGLTRYRPEHRMPTIGILVQETFPTGKYDNLGEHSANGIGGGAYTTSISLNSQTYFWAPNGRILRMRLNGTGAFSTNVNVSGVSVYGTDASFHGHAKPGPSSSVDWAWEYSLRRSWVLALDVTYAHNGNTQVTGSDSLGSAIPSPPIRLNSGSSDTVGFAPAIEYSWKSTIGILIGTRILAIGRNMATTVTPAIAINYVR
jgi:hypothetical protein